ncbi:NB-ARC domain-containing protein [Phormidesmis priestleyi]|uniref:NB-ARC domain-containing protein n=1 Tax=Phormidesmis priestleyi TaxID=268141 RepID=UPI00083A41BE|nr:NB-ARC domain-containing protein [Phormidesmis priestleyi]
MSESSKNKPDEYDSTTDYHYLKFENRCLRGNGDDFQEIFEEIMVRARPGEFERVRPYGRFGDRKCDGLIESEGIIFQVYSPDKLKQAEVQKKIDEDLEGAVQHWSDILKKWVFVYNAKRGTSSDIKLTLQQKQKQYPDIEIDSWSNDYLWEITRELSLQQRSEILGASPQWNVEKPKSKAHIPNLPFHFLKRSTDLDTLKNLVLSSSIQSTGITRSTLKVGVYGMGGIGKSVLAAMLARDPEVRAAFPDGIFWITLGQEPILALRQLDLARILGDASLPFQDVQQGKIHLSQLLGDKTCLLILDDVWKADHVAAFNILGEQSGLLFTTRDSSIVKALNASEHRVDLLSDDEALELLTACSGQCQETLPIEAHEIVKECGNLPLALSMIGAIAKARPDRWDNLLYKLQNADLDKIRHEFPDYPYPDLLKAIQVSVNALEPAVKVRYLDFAVFLEDTAIPETTLRTFWEPEGLDEYDTQDVIDTLVERSLARWDEAGNLTIHDLQYDYVRKQNSDSTALHNRLLDAYATHCINGWYTGLNDGYFFENLTFHLIKAERKEELYRLLVGSPDWMEAKFINCRGDSSYVADIKMAIDELNNSSDASQLLVLVRLNAAHQVVYERSSQYDNDYLEILAWLGREAESISHARLTLDINRRYIKLLAIYDALRKRGKDTSALLDELWQTARLTQNNGHEPIDTWALGGVAVRLYASGRQEDANLALAEAEVTALKPNPDWLYYVLGQRNPDSRATDVQAKDESKIFTRDWLRVEAIRQLAIAFSQCGNNSEAFKALKKAKQIAVNLDDSQQSGSYKTKVQLLERIGLSMVRAGYLEDAKSTLHLVIDESNSAEIWRNLGLELSKMPSCQIEIKDAFRKAERSIYRTEDKYLQVTQIAYLAVALIQAGEPYREKAVSNFNQALLLAETFDEEYQKTQALKALVNAYAQAGYFIEAKEALQKINHYDKSWALRDLAVKMAAAGFPEAEKTARTISDRDEQVEALVGLALTFARSGNIEDASRIFYEVQEKANPSFAEKHLDSRLLHDIALALIEAKEFSKAESVIESIHIDPANGYKIFQGDAWRKIDVMIEFALSLTQSGNARRSRQAFNNAEDMLERLEIKEDKLKLYKKLKLTLINANYLEEANKVSKKIAKTFKQDVEIRLFVPVNVSDIEAKEKSTSQLLFEGNIKEAFSELVCQSLIGFLCSLSKEAAAFESIEKGLSIAVLKEALYIATWKRPNYQKIYELIRSI